ncbi:glycine cleavage system protein R [Idiomarina xiamenensis]|uniref:Glycine cleavage system transcriptional repressor n=1 Tax=Idiomarina xiamenensis 10-D-4 TaxID=740709 RepID=K2KWK4_9GAMM|nr:ACT domain-containing protein [Idiomarina xiamenensis]EKE86864.1 glycine cleavage system transcriptional repressor [Idiomarina xiamenensis 10-D-4]
MSQQLIITAMGSNRVGIVKQVTELVSDCDCNIVDSRMALFGQEFVLTLLLAGTSASLDRIEHLLPTSAIRMELLTMSKRTQPRPLPPFPHRAEIILRGNDAPGILKSISDVLADAAVDIVSLRSESEQMADCTCLQMSLVVQASDEDSYQRMQKHIQAHCQTLAIDCQIHALSSVVSA